jgi:hypothetical protein
MTYLLLRVSTAAMWNVSGRRLRRKTQSFSGGSLATGFVSTGAPALWRVEVEAKISSISTAPQSKAEAVRDLAEVPPFRADAPGDLFVLVQVLRGELPTFLRDRERSRRVRGGARHCL